MTIQEKEENNQKKSGTKIVIFLLVLAFIIGSIYGVYYFIEKQKYIESDNAFVKVPIIQLTSSSPGILKEVYVKEGQNVEANQSLARVGDNIIQSEIAGIITMVKQDFGANYSPSQPVISMYDPSQMKIIASIEENKGLTDLKVLDKVKFTVDAFGKEEFNGFIEEISPVSNIGDIVFSISDKRQTQKFNIKIHYNIADYPNFKNGMSAKVKIYK